MDRGAGIGIQQQGRHGLGSGLGGFGLGEIFPFAPAVEVDEGLHAAPFHDFAFEPDEVGGLG